MVFKVGLQPWAVGVFGAAVLIAGPAFARQEPPRAGASEITGAMVALPDGRRLHLRCTGSGGPTVILDAGLGLGSFVWSRVQPQLGAITRTCAYDRAGYGQSDPGPLPRDVAHRTDDLVALLEATEEEGPFVLVAHSAAELPARIAASRRSDLVAGLVLVDSGADVEALKIIAPVWAAAYEAAQSSALTCIRATANGEMTPGTAIYVECGSPPTDGPLASRSMAAAVISENEADPSDQERSASAGLPGDLPVIVLTAGNKFGANEGAAASETAPLRTAWTAAGALIAASSTRGEQRLVPDASHVIQFEQPQAVVDAVCDVVEQVRARE